MVAVKLAELARELHGKAAGIAPIQPIACKAGDFVFAQQFDYFPWHGKAALEVIPACLGNPQKPCKFSTAVETFSSAEALETQRGRVFFIVRHIRQAVVSALPQL